MVIKLRNFRVKMVLRAIKNYFTKLYYFEYYLYY